MPPRLARTASRPAGPGNLGCGTARAGFRSRGDRGSRGTGLLSIEYEEGSMNEKVSSLETTGAVMAIRCPVEMTGTVISILLTVRLLPEM